MPTCRPAVPKKPPSAAHPTSITGAAFWALMGRWKISDEAALRLIDGPPLTRTGKRPRFRLVGEQVERFTFLREIDWHLNNIYGEPSTWLASSKVFSTGTPLEHMLRHGSSGITAVLQFLKLQSFKASL